MARRVEHRLLVEVPHVAAHVRLEAEDVARDHLREGAHRAALREAVEAYEAKRSRRGKKRRTDKKGQKAICSKCEVEYDPGSYRGKSPLCKKCRLKGG